MKNLMAKVLLVGATIGSTNCLCAELAILSTPTLKGALQEIAQPFEQQSGHKLLFSFDGVRALTRRIESGEAFSAAVLLPSDIDRLVGLGKIKAGSRVDTARTAAGVAIKAGAPRPSLGSIAELKRALLSAKSISFSPDSASSAYFLALVEQLGISNEIKPKLISVTGRSPVDAVASGQAELTVITTPNIVGAAGVELAGLLPDEVQNYAVFSAGISNGPIDASAAAEFLTFLKSPAAIAAIRKHGLEPLP